VRFTASYRKTGVRTGGVRGSWVLLFGIIAVSPSGPRWTESGCRFFHGG
jgi:hypothetical protein